MEKTFHLLDCTLREAPLENLMWGQMFIKKMIHGLENAGIDIIEVGFLTNKPYVAGSTSFQSVEEIGKYLTNKKPGVQYVALVDYGRYDLRYLSPYDGNSIDAIRICFKHHQIEEVLAYASQIREKGYKVCIQHVDTMGYSNEEILRFIEKVNAFKPYAYSIVDTFGSMYASDVSHFTKLVADNLSEDILLGFHAHNNLMLADANVQLFLSEYNGKRKIIVDSSLYGCGRSAGNAHTELIAQFLNKTYSTAYDIDEILDLIDTVIVAVREKTEWGYSIPYFISGIFNAHSFNAKQLMKRHNLRSRDLLGIMGRLDETQKKKYDYALLERLYVEYFDTHTNDSETVQALSRKLADNKILLLGPGKTINDKKFKISDFIELNAPTVIAVNNLIEGFKLDFIFYSSATRYKNLQYQDYKTVGSPSIILTSNIKDSSEEELIVDYKSLIKFGWVNLDSSFILLLRLLQRCSINEIYAAGLDGYQDFGNTFYNTDLEVSMDLQDRLEQTEDNLSMLRDMRKTNPDFKIHFLTQSIYEEAFEDDKGDRI